MTNLNIAKLYLAANAGTDAATIDAAIADGSANTAVQALSTAAFGRSADAEGLAYWSDRIDSGMAKDDAFMTALTAGDTAYVAPTAENPLVIGDQTFTAATASATDDVAVAASNGTAIGAAAVAMVSVVDTATATTAVATIESASDALITPTYTIAADATSVTEGNSVVFTVTASEALAATATTLNYQIAGIEVAGGTATPADDLGKVTGEVTIAAGATTGTITLTPTDDGVTVSDLQIKVIAKGGNNTRRTGIHPIAFITQVNQKLKEILGTGYTSHSFRQGLITEMGSKQINTKIISKFIGHSDVKTTMRYINPTDEDLKGAMIR